LNILIIDDNKDILEILNIYLSENHRVRIFNCSQMALKTYQKYQNFDLIITDFFMPLLFGYSLIESILKINSSQNIIICSGTPCNEIDLIVNRYRDLIQLIKKPFDFSEFDKAIDTFFSDN